MYFFSHHFFSFGGKLLHSQSYTIEQTWSQENNYNREYHVKVPSGEGPFPVLIIFYMDCVAKDSQCCVDFQNMKTIF